MNLSFITKNWGLKLLALALAIVLYYALKPETIHHSTDSNDQRITNTR